MSSGGSLDRLAELRSECKCDSPPVHRNSRSSMEMSSGKASKSAKRGQLLPAAAASPHLPASAASIVASSAFASSCAASVSRGAASSFPSLAPMERFDAFNALVRSTAAPLAELRGLGKSVQSATSRPSMEAASGAMMRKADEVQSTLRRARAQLKQIEEEDAALAAQVGPSTAAAQIRANLRSKATRTLAKAMSDLQATLEGAQAELSRRSERELRLVAPELSASDVQRLVEADKASEFVQAHLLSDAAHPPTAELLASVGRIQERQLGILALERQVAQLAELFKDLAFLVDAQQESIHVIDRAMRNARDSAEQGELKIRQADKYQSKARKRRCCLAGLVTCCLAAILTPTLLAKFGKLKP